MVPEVTAELSELDRASCAATATAASLVRTWPLTTMLPADTSSVMWSAMMLGSPMSATSFALAWPWSKSSRVPLSTSPNVTRAS